MLPTATMETEASQMLEAALEQMDDIIAGKSEEVAVCRLYDMVVTLNLWSSFQQIASAGCSIFKETLWASGSQRMSHAQLQHLLLLSALILSNQYLYIHENNDADSTVKITCHLVTSQ